MKTLAIRAFSVKVPATLPVRFGQDDNFRLGLRPDYYTRPDAAGGRRIMPTDTFYKELTQPFSPKANPKKAWASTTPPAPPTAKDAALTIFACKRSQMDWPAHVKFSKIELMTQLMTQHREQIMEMVDHPQQLLHVADLLLDHTQVDRMWAILHQQNEDGFKATYADLKKAFQAVDRSFRQLIGREAYDRLSHAANVLLPFHLLREEFPPPHPDLPECRHYKTLVSHAAQGICPSPEETNWLYSLMLQRVSSTVLAKRLPAYQDYIDDHPML